QRFHSRRPERVPYKVDAAIGGHVEGGRLRVCGKALWIRASEFRLGDQQVPDRQGVRIEGVESGRDRGRLLRDAEIRAVRHRQGAVETVRDGELRVFDRTTVQSEAVGRVVAEVGEVEMR